MPLHCQSKEKEIQKKRNIKLRKIDKRKRKMFSSHMHHNTLFIALCEREEKALTITEKEQIVILISCAIFGQ